MRPRSVDLADLRATIARRPDSLGRAFDPRSNAITPIRLALALAVVVSHSYKLGGFGRDPLETITGGQTQLGGVAVTCFFVLSGFLLARSRERAKAPMFIANRALRIVPGLWACLLVTAFLLAPVGSLLGHTPYAADSAARYVAGNAGIVVLAPFMGDLFRNNPWSLAVNGSLWTLTPELLCYVGLAALPGRALRLVLPGFLLASLVLVIVRSAGYAPGVLALGHPLAFAIGAVCYLHRDLIPIRGRGALLALAWLAIITIAGAFDALAVFGLGYLLLWAAVTLPFRSSNDLSYGVYVYAFPLQQVLASAGLFAAGFLPFLGASLGAALAFGWLSWHAVEARALRLKGRRPQVDGDRGAALPSVGVAAAG